VQDKDTEISKLKDKISKQDDKIKELKENLKKEQHEELEQQHQEELKDKDQDQQNDNGPNSQNKCGEAEEDDEFFGQQERVDLEDGSGLLERIKMRLQKKNGKRNSKRSEQAWEPTNTSPNRDERIEKLRQSRLFNANGSSGKKKKWQPV